MTEPLVVGIPLEIKPAEKRVALTPEGTRRLREAGIQVVMEAGAGQGSGFTDAEYTQAGATLVSRPRELYRKAGLVRKVKEPLPLEWEFLRPNHVLFSFLHLGAPENRNLVGELLARKVVAIGFETVEKEGRTIFLEPMSEMAGTLSAYFAGFFKRFAGVENRKIVYPPRFFEKLESLASLYPEVPQHLSPGKVAIFGGGTVGKKAVEMVLKMGGEVDLIERRAERRKLLQEEFKDFGTSFRTWGLEEGYFERLKTADVWMGAVHVAGEKAPLVLSREDLGRFSQEKPKLIFDIAIDQGGNFPGARSTNYQDPLYLDPFGNWRFGVTNMPSLCGREATVAIERLTLPYTMALAQDWQKALRELPELRRGLQVVGGKLVHEAVARAHGLGWEPFKG